VAPHDQIEDYRATEGGEVYIPNTLSPGQSFAFQPDPESHEFDHKAQATVAPSWREELEGTHYSVYLEAAEEASRLAVEWFTEYLEP
jgi:hypothetical protein